MRRSALLVVFAVASVACGSPAPLAPSSDAPTPRTALPSANGTARTNGTASATGVERASGYDRPPQNVLDVMRAPSPPVPYVSPTYDTILLVSWVDYPPIAQVAEPFLKLAGVRVEPKSRRRHDTPAGYGITECARDFTLTKVATGAETRVTLPAGCTEAPFWSADGKRFAFRTTEGDAVRLYVGDAATGALRVMADAKLNPMLDDAAQWMPDQRTLLVKLVPRDAGTPPEAKVAASGPNIQETGGQKGESSTYETRDTLKSKDDEALFDYYATSQLALIDASTGKITPIGKPGIYADLEPSPDGQHVLVKAVHKPYSYVVTHDRFPRDVEVWSVAGVPEKTMASLPLADRVPVHGVPVGPRDFAWRSNDPATLVWAEALDGGDWKAKVPARDKVMMQKAPFSNAPTEITRTEQRFTGMAWGEKANVALLHDYDDNKHWRRTFAINVDDPKDKPRVIWDLSTDERYKNPGTPVYKQLANGYWVMRQDGDSIFMKGTGSSPDGDRPFLDRFDLKTKTSERLFRSDKTAFERFLTFTDDDRGGSFLTWHQTPVDPPNAFVRTLGAKVANAPAEEATVTSTPRAVTHIADPTPIVRTIKKRLVKYKRKDGVDLSFTIYTPPNYQEGTRVPAILYAYPLDYADPSKAGQVTGSEQMFTRLRNYRLLLLAGYAIIDNASFPIVGDPKRAYDTYLDQLVADAKAAVDKAVQIGVADPDRIGITGHSHGALMTANLLAHSDLFRAGVATSGSYNKTLTPFGFQNERRSVWEAQSVYLRASTFFFADKMKLPILIMHGEDDANPGTTPLQATKLFEAVRGNGGTARLVMLPHEPHWYAAMESNEQVVAEMIRWFDKYVKEAPRRTH